MMCLLVHWDEGADCTAVMRAPAAALCRLLECLRFMIQERQQHLSGDATAATRTASAPLPVLAVAKLPRTLPPETMQPRSCPPASSWVPSSSSIGCNTPSATLRPPLPLAYGASGDYSQELPREESWFV